jgi:hypothetical protein
VQICVCGWYYPRPFYEGLRAVDGRHDIVVVANRPGDALGLRTIARENVGLDWGSYSSFLEHAWDGAADVLFLQDDTRVREPFWDEMAAIPYDQAFVFRDRAEFEAAYSHGRAHFASARLLALVRAHGGIWFDLGNRGFIAAGTSWSETPPPGCLDHNAGIRAYTQLVQRIGAEHAGLSVDRRVYCEHVWLGRRGTVTPWRSPTPGSSPSGRGPAQATASRRSSACSATPT